MARSPREAPPGRSSHRRRSGHHATDSTGELIPRSRDFTPQDTPRKSHTGSTAQSKTLISEVSKASSNPLSAAALAQLDAATHALGWSAYDGLRTKGLQTEARTHREKNSEEEQGDDEYRAAKEKKRRERRAYREVYGEDHAYREEKDRRRERKRQQRDEGEHHRRKQRRVISGPLLEEGGKERYEYKGRARGGAESEGYEDRRRRKKRIWIAVGVIALVLLIAIPVGVVLSNRNSSDLSNNDASPATPFKPANTNLNAISESSIPAAAKGTVVDPFIWYDTTGFNVTYTDATVGGLPIMGLNSTWDDTKRANDNVPPLDESWSYGSMPIRGINVGGWLSLEPLITPSFFSEYNSRANVIDEWTLTSSLGPTRAAQTMERHYSSFITEADFAAMQAAGFDHVRIPFSYWAITTYEGDPYVPKISWRYLLRGIEYARKYGLRVNLDLHGAPGSQNGWNHSGRQGVIGWLNGTDGTLNGQRTLDVHGQLSTFFAQPRYKNIVTMYGIVNEPRMVALPTDVVLDWTTKAISVIRGNNITAILVFGDGFLGLDKWQGQLQNVDSQPSSLLLDVHQYVVFNTDQLALSHTDKINFACAGWTQQALRSSNPATGFGPTMCGEWSQADTDCAPNLNNVGQGNRWQGTLNTGILATSVLEPTCPTNNSPRCDCGPANADPSTYSEAYKLWLRMFAEAQMHSFERGWGWFYWTWQNEGGPGAVQWSYKRGLEAGILPSRVWEREFDCQGAVPDFGSLGLSETY